MGTTGAAHYGRDTPKNISDALNRMTPQVTSNFNKREPYSLVSRLITRLYPEARSIIVKLIMLKCEVRPVRRGIIKGVCR